MLTLVLPEIFICIMGSCVLLSGVYFQRYKQLPYILSLSTLLVVAGITIYITPLISNTVFNDAYTVDRFSCLIKLFLYVFLACILIYSKIYMQLRHFLHAEFFSLALFSLLGMMIISSSADFLTMFLGLELLVLPLYAMIVMVKKQAKYSEAAMKYFIVGSLGVGLLLYGISLIYGATGSFVFTDIASSTVSPSILKLGMLLVITGVALEFGAVPFHMWLPDVYEGSPTPVTMIIGTLPKIAVFAMSYRLLTQAFPNINTDWQQILLVFAVLSIALGNLVAIAQTNFKRMLAYSTIAHIGYIFLGIFVAPQQGYIAALFYTVTYALMALAAFAMIVRLSSDGFESDQIADFRGLNSRNPWLAFLLLLIMFSLAGVPPLLGFYAKFLVLQAVVAAGYWSLAILALVFSVIGAFYYLRIVKLMYFDAPSPGQLPLANDGMSLKAKVLVSANSLLLLLLGIVPGTVFYWCIYSLQ